jgi:hypothetical protein
MIKLQISGKIVAFILVLAFTFQSMESINSHTYASEITTFHEDRPDRISCYFGHSYPTICKLPNHF